MMRFGADRGRHYLAGYIVLGGITSVIGSFVGPAIALLIVGEFFRAWSLVFNPGIAFSALSTGFLLSLPLTFLLFPLAAIVLKRRPALRQLSLGYAGIVAAALVTWFWATYGTEMGTELKTIFILAAAVTGMVTGMFYASAVHDAGK